MSSGFIHESPDVQVENVFKFSFAIADIAFSNLNNSFRAFS